MYTATHTTRTISSTAISTTTRRTTTEEGVSTTTTEEPTTTNTPAMCSEDEVEVVAETVTSDRFCRKADFNFVSSLPLTASITLSKGQAAVPSNFAHSPQTGIFSATAVVGTPVANMRILAQVGNVPASRTGLLSTVTPDGSIVDAVLRSSHIYHDSALVLASFQVRDVTTFSATTAPVKIVVKATPKNNNALKSVQIEKTCGGSSPGVCHVSLGMDQSFTALQKNEVYAISYGKVGGLLTSLGNVMLMMPAATSVNDEILDTLYTSLPAKPLYAGDEFDLKVQSRFSN